MTTQTTNDLQEAAVAVVLEEAAKAMEAREQRSYSDGFTEVYKVASVLVDRGLLDDWSNEVGHASKDRARVSAEAKVRRLLVKEAESDSPRILRFTRDDGAIPRLTGERRSSYGGATVFTSPGVIAAATEACEARMTKARSDQAHMDQLLRIADDLGLPKPQSSSAYHVSFEREDFRALLVRLEAVRTVADSVERDRREPDKLLCHVQSMRREVT